MLMPWWIPIKMEMDCNCETLNDYLKQMLLYYNLLPNLFGDYIVRNHSKLTSIITLLHMRMESWASSYFTNKSLSPIIFFCDNPSAKADDFSQRKGFEPQFFVCVMKYLAINYLTITQGHHHMWLWCNSYEQAG